MQKRLITIVNILFTLIIVTFNAANLQAATPVIHTAPRPAWISECKPYNKRPSERNVRNGAYTELAEEQVNVAQQAIYNHYITVIVSESGVQNNSDISVSFDPAYERLDFHQITIWRNNKPQNRLNIAEFKLLPQESELDKFIYNGTYSAKLILPDVRKGDKIEYAYTITGSNPIFKNKFCRSIYFQGSDLIMHQYTTLLFPESKKLNIKSFNLLSQPKITNAGGLKRYEWEDFQVPGISTYKYVPKWVNNFAHVQVSEYNRWGEVVNWGLSINPLTTSFTGELADSIAQLKRLYGNNKEKYFRAAVALVQDEVRYMGIETGPYSHQANTPAKVFNQRYGDCKDKSLLLASILNAGGIEAHMALLNTDLGDKIAESIPATKLFDHAVVVATVNGKQAWVDATISNQGGKGTDLYFPPYQKALVLKFGNNSLTDIKPTAAGKVVAEEKYTVKDEFAPVYFTVTTTYTLSHADDIRDDLASTGIAQTEKSYLDYYAKNFSKIELADSMVIKDDKVKNVLTTIERYKISNFFKRDSVNGKYSADFYADDISRQLPDIADNVKTPVAIAYPYDMDLTIKIITANGWDIENEHNQISRNGYKFIADQTITGNELALRYQFSTLKNFIPVSELSDYRKDVKDLKDDKLDFNFYYIPDIKKVPFKLNMVMFIITVILICACTYAGFTIFRMPTTNSWHTTKIAPPLGGWLIWLLIVLIATPLGIINNIVKDGHYATSTWDLYVAGAISTAHRALLIFELTGYIITICFSVFCIILVVRKRDIAPRFIKLYYLISVIFLFIDYFFTLYVKVDYANSSIEQLIEAVIMAALWTYLLNTSARVQETFIVPRPQPE
jgi:transglutaminase-like putative cysteine protease